MTHEGTLPENGFYYHYKHDPSKAWNDHAYEVVGVARHTEDKSFLVLYLPVYENDWFKPATHQARPLEMFMETVEVGGVIRPRFKKVTDPELIDRLVRERNALYA